MLRYFDVYPHWLQIVDGVIVWNILFYVQDLTNWGQKAEKDGQNGERSKVSATANDDVSLII